MAEGSLNPLVRQARLLLPLLLLVADASLAQLPSSPLDRNGQSVSVEPYAPNIVRITLSTEVREAVAAPGPGFVAAPDSRAWRHSTDAHNADTYASPRMTVTVAPAYKRDPTAKLPDTAAFFSGSTAGLHIAFTLPDGSPITTMTGWEMAAPNQKDDTLKNLRGIRPEDLPLYTVGATFSAPDNEHYYGLGENQEGYLDHRQRPVTCAANYLAPAAPTYCVPFLVTNRGYGILWDNPSATTISPGFDGRTTWTWTLDRRVSFFVIVGRTTDEI